MLQVQQIRVALQQESQQQQERPDDSVALILTEASDIFGMAVLGSVCETCNVHTAILLLVGKKCGQTPRGWAAIEGRESHHAIGPSRHRIWVKLHIIMELIHEVGGP